MRVFIILCLMALAAALPGCGVTSHTVATKVTMPPGGCSSGADVTVHSTTDVELARPTCNLASKRAGAPQSAPNQAGPTPTGQSKRAWPQVAVAAPFQFAVRGPSDPIRIEPQGARELTLEKGTDSGLGVMRSDGIVTPDRCTAALAAARVDGSGAVMVAIETGDRDRGGWMDVASARATGVGAIPATVVPNPASLRVWLSNPTDAAVTVWPERTAFTVLGLDCG